MGQRVFAANRPGGNWAQYAVMAAKRAYPVPDDIPDEQIASLMINPATAILMVRHVLAVPRGEWLLQSAAGGELGRMIIRLAKHDGIRTINVVRRHEAAQELKALGADEVIVSSEGPIDDQVHKIVAGGRRLRDRPGRRPDRHRDLPVAVHRRPHAGLRLAER